MWRLFLKVLAGRNFIAHPTLEQNSDTCFGNTVSPLHQKPDSSQRDQHNTLNYEHPLQHLNFLQPHWRACYVQLSLPARKLIPCFLEVCGWYTKNKWCNIRKYSSTRFPKLLVPFNPSCSHLTTRAVGPRTDRQFVQLLSSMCFILCISEK